MPALRTRRKNDGFLVAEPTVFAVTGFAASLLTTFFVTEAVAVFAATFVLVDVDFLVMFALVGVFFTVLVFALEDVVFAISGVYQIASTNRHL